MAFIPDDAEDRFNELSPSAERFYIYLCRKRNHKMRVSFGTIEECAAKYDWKRATKFAVIKELTSKGWISSDGHAWHLLVGDFSPVDKSKNLDSHQNESKNLDCQSKKSDDKSKNLDSHIRNIPALPAEPENTQRAGAKFPLKELFEAFPQIEFNSGQLGFVLAAVKEADKAAWLSTIKIYLQNHDPTRNRYMPDKIGNLLSVFEAEKARLGKQNGSNQTNNRNAKRTDEQNFAESADFYAEWQAREAGNHAR